MEDSVSSGRCLCQSDCMPAYLFAFMRINIYTGVLFGGMTLDLCVGCLSVRQQKTSCLV